MTLRHLANCLLTLESNESFAGPFTMRPDGTPASAAIEYNAKMQFKLAVHDMRTQLFSDPVIENLRTLTFSRWSEELTSSSVLKLIGELVRMRHYDTTKQAEQATTEQAAELLKNRAVNEVTTIRTMDAFPSSIRNNILNWLKAEYLNEPAPAEVDGTQIAMVPLSRFTDYLHSLSVDVILACNACRNSNWTEDYLIVLSERDNPNSPPESVKRWNLPSGTHRMLGIRKQVLFAEQTYSPDNNNDLASNIVSTKRNQFGTSGTKPCGRPSLEKSKDPKSLAKLNAYKLIARAKADNPSFGPQRLLEHFRSKKDFKALLDQAGLPFKRKTFETACRWIAENKTNSEETPVGNVSS